jgi:hypothetical protein
MAVGAQYGNCHHRRRKHDDHGNCIDPWGERQKSVTDS